MVSPISLQSDDIRLESPRVFYSIDYNRDLDRVRRVPQSERFTFTTAAGWKDVSAWKSAQMEGEDAVKQLICEALDETSVTVVFIGYASDERHYLQYEIEESLRRGNALVGMTVNHLRNHCDASDPSPAIPPEIEAAGYKVCKFVSLDKLEMRIAEALQISLRLKE